MDYADLLPPNDNPEQTTHITPGRRPSLGLPPDLERLERVLFPAHLERAALGLAFPVFPVLAALLLERHEPDLLGLDPLGSVFGKKVVRHVLQVGLLPRRPAELAIVPEVGKLCGVLLEVSEV